MKILHVYNHFHPCVGGVEKQIEDICLNLIKRGHKSDVCCLDTCAHSKETLKKVEKYKGIDIHRISYRDFKYYKIAPSVLKIIKKYDIVHIHCMGFFLDYLASAKKIHKKSLILSTHGGIFHTKKLEFAKKIYFNYWAKHKLKNINKVIAISPNDEKIFSKISKNVVFIPDGIDTKKYLGVKRTPDKNKLLYIGRLSPNKRIDRLLDMMFLLRETNPSARLYLAGKDYGGHKKYLEEIVSRGKLSKNVIFTGEISEKEKMNHLSNAGIFVSSSEYEGFGMSVVEAMAAGVPVVVSDIESFRNFVDNGKNGFIADFSNAKKSSEMISKIMKKNLSEISSEAKRSAKEYAWENIIKKIEDVYEKSI